MQGNRTLGGVCMRFRSGSSWRRPAGIFLAIGGSVLLTLVIPAWLWTFVLGVFIVWLGVSLVRS